MHQIRRHGSAQLADCAPCNDLEPASLLQRAPRLDDSMHNLALLYNSPRRVCTNHLAEFADAMPEPVLSTPRQRHQLQTRLMLVSLCHMQRILVCRAAMTSATHGCMALCRVMHCHAAPRQTGPAAWMCRCAARISLQAVEHAAPQGPPIRKSITSEREAARL